MSDITTLAGLLGLARERITAGLGDRDAAARLPVLATRDAQGWPSARTMVLRSFDARDWTLDIHSDADAAKVLQLTDGPRAAIHVWDAEASLQIRMRAHVVRLPHDEEKGLWEEVPESARAQYGAVPPPGTPIAAAEAWHPNPRPARFAVLRARVLRVELLHIGEIHRRARYEREEGWQGSWLVP